MSATIITTPVFSSKKIFICLIAKFLLQCARVQQSQEPENTVVGDFFVLYEQ